MPELQILGTLQGKEAISAIVGDTPHVLVNMVIGRKRDKTIGAVSLSALLPDSLARGTPAGRVHGETLERGSGYTMKQDLPGAVLEFLGGLTITQGRLAGEPFPVFPWQRRFVQGAFVPPEVIEAALIEVGTMATRH